MAFLQATDRAHCGVLRSAKLLLVLMLVPVAGAFAQAPEQRPAETPPAAATTAAGATASATAEAAQPVRIWVVACDEPRGAGPRRCEMSATARLEGQDRSLLTVLLIRQPETGSLGMVFQVAHGVALPPGLTWQVDDGEAQRLAFQSSDANGVYVGIPVGDDLLAALRRGSVMHVSFVNGANREVVTVTLPLAQFADASTEFFAAEREAAK